MKNLFDTMDAAAGRLYCHLVDALIDVTTRLPFAVFFVLFLLFGP